MKQLLDSHQQLRIGFAVSGNPRHKNDQHRSIPLAEFAPLLSHAKFFLLQKELNASDTAFLNQHPEISDLSESMHDFSDTAAIIENMDLIISVDTSLAHLAGSLGKPTYLMLPWNPEWRWLTKRSDSPWYPTIQLFRQSSLGNWSSVIEPIRSKLMKETINS